MILRRFLPLTVVVPAALATTLVYADATADAKKVIAADYAKIDAAANRKDPDGMTAFYAPDCVFIAKNGQKVTLEQMKQQARGITASMKSIKAHSQVVSFKLNGANAAVAVSKEHAELATVDPQRNQPMKIVINGTVEDTWIKSGGKWLIKKSREISRTITMNGKPVGRK